MGSPGLEMDGVPHGYVDRALRVRDGWGSHRCVNRVLKAM